MDLQVEIVLGRLCVLKNTRWHVRLEHYVCANNSVNKERALLWQKRAADTLHCQQTCRCCGDDRDGVSQPFGIIASAWSLDWCKGKYCWLAVGLLGSDHWFYDECDLMHHTAKIHNITRQYFALWQKVKESDWKLNVVCEYN